MNKKFSRFNRIAIQLAGAFAVSSLAMANVANAALIHEYTFSGGTVAVDSAGGANGTLFGGAAIVGGELSLDGTSAYVETIGSHIVPLSGNFTLSFDARQNAFASHHVELISQGYSGGQGFYVGYNPSGFMRFSDANPSTSIAFPADGNYHNYVLSQSGSTTSFYIDSVLTGTFSSLGRGAGGDNTRFGTQFGPNGYGEYFNGVMDNIRVYDTDLAGIAPPTAAVPEPETYAMLLAGLGLMGFAGRRRKARGNA